MVTMITIFTCELLFFKDFFSLSSLDTGMYLLIVFLIMIAVVLWKEYNKLFVYVQNNNRKFKRMLE